MIRFISSTLFFLIVALSGPAYAVSVEHNFSANWSSESGPTNFFGPGDSVSGSFFYDSSVPAGGLLPPPPALTVYAGAMTNLSGSLSGNGFTDTFGVATVNDIVDRIQLSADPGVGLGPLAIRNLSGFTIDGFTLANVRFFWQDLNNDVITDEALPPVLPPPGFELGDARVAFDFVNGPLDSPDTVQHIVFFDSLTVTAVPEPSTILLLGTGLAGLGLWRWKTGKQI